MTDGAKRVLDLCLVSRQWCGDHCNGCVCPKKLPAMEDAARIALAVEAHLKYWRGRPGYCGQKDAIRLLEAIKAGEDPDNDRG